MMEGDVPNIEDLNIQLQVQPNYNQPKSIQVGLNFHALLYQMDLKFLSESLIFIALFLVFILNPYLIIGWYW